MWCECDARPQHRAASARPAQRSEAEPRALRCGGWGRGSGPSELFPRSMLRSQKTCPAGLIVFGAGHVRASRKGRPLRGVKGLFCGFRSNLEGTPLKQLGGLGSVHMAGAENDQANGPLLDRFFFPRSMLRFCVPSVPYEGSSRLY